MGGGTAMLAAWRGSALVLVTTLVLIDITRVVAKSKSKSNKAAPAPGGRKASARPPPPPTTTTTPPPFIAALGASRSETEASSVLDAVTDADFKKLPFPEVERLVHHGWWNVSTMVVVRSHSARIDFTPAVRKATGEVKKKADALLRWLDPAFAHPSPTAMAVRWAQNTTAVMIAARFSPSWDGPGGANVAVFSSEKGRGHIDKERTEELVRRQLQVVVDRRHLEADITADAGNARKRFKLDAGLFDEAVPERSSWSVEFRRAQGSMQMSTGALIPELRIFLRKRWPGTRQWPRLTAKKAGQGGLEPSWWTDAPGVSEDDTALLRGSPPQIETALTCAANDEVFCARSDACVPACSGHCPEAPTQHSSQPRCVAAPKAAISETATATFQDEDLGPAAVGGFMRFKHEISGEDAIEQLAFHWGHSATEVLANHPSIATAAVFADSEPSFWLPLGTSPPSGASHLLVIASNEIGKAIVAAATLIDRVHPPPPQGLRFKDADPIRNQIGGSAEVDRAADETHVESYELHFGLLRDGSVQAIDGPALATASPRAVGAPSEPLQLEIKGNPAVPSRASHLIAFAIGAGEVRSKPEFIMLQDAGPPTVAAQRVYIGIDADARLGFVDFTVSYDRNFCDPAPHQARDRLGSTAVSCDEGSSSLIYFATANGSRLGAPLGELSLQDSARGREFAGEIPAGATHLTVIARNEFGEMPQGPMQKFVDNKTATLAAWTWTRVLLTRSSDDSWLWRPFSPEKDSKSLNEEFGSSRVAALSLDALGYDAFGGRDDGTVACLDLGSDKVWHSLAGVSSVTSLAADGEKMQAVRGARSGYLDVWDLNSDEQGRHLVGHRDDVVAIDVDWPSNRAVTASLDGQVILWDLAKAIETGRLPGHDAGVTALAVGWKQGLALSASYDETLRLWSIKSSSLVATLEGHSEAVKFVEADWESMRALSVSEERTVKLWSLDSYECTSTFRSPDEAQVLAVHVEWKSMQAMAVLADGTASIWDLKEPTRNPLATASFGSNIQLATIRAGQEGQIGRSRKKEK